MHSLGNYLLEQFVHSPIFSEETRIFDNVILHQADVDHKTHTEWVDQIKYGKRLYITINENDSVLKASDFINPDRLGNTAEALTAQRAIYMDFTHGGGVKREHNFFTGDHGNATIYQFFQEVLNSRHGEFVEGFKQNLRTNTYIVRDWK